MGHIISSDCTLVKAFYYRDKIQYHKPDPRAFDELLNEHELSPEHCVYVGDSVSDAIASKEAGLLFVANLESGLRQKENFINTTVDAYIRSFPDIINIIKKF